MYVFLSKLIPGLLLLLLGCSGVDTRIALTDLEHPTSMSAYIYGPKGKALALEKDLKVVGQVEVGGRVWTTG